MKTFVWFTFLKEAVQCFSQEFYDDQSEYLDEGRALLELEARLMEKFNVCDPQVNYTELMKHNKSGKDRGLGFL